MRPTFFAGVLAAASLPLPAVAQEQPAQGGVRQDPNTGVAPRPSFPSPPPAAATAAPARTASPNGSVTLSDVYVAVEPVNFAAYPLSGWAPRPDPTTGLTLDHRLGEAFDWQWVHRQFQANGIIGHETGYDRIAALVQLINLAFVQNGFINSGVLIDRQELTPSDGILRIRLVAGHLVPPTLGGEAINVTWQRHHRRGLTDSYIRNRLAGASDVPLDMRALERDFRLLADNSAIRTVNVNLVPGLHPGQASLAVAVEPADRLDVYSGVANSRSPSVGGNRFFAGGAIQNALTAGDTLSAETGSTSGLRDFTASYTMPLLGPGGSFTIRGGFDNAAVTDRPLLPLNITSKEWFVEGGPTKTVFERPLLPGHTPGSWTAAQRASVGFSIVHRRLISTLLGQPFSFSPGSVNGRTEYTAIRFTGDYVRRTPLTVLALSMTASVGIEGTRSPANASPRANDGFTSLLLQLNFAHRLNPHQLELRFRLAGQATGGIVYSSERFSIGGAETVRGYREGLLLADEALVGSLELAQPMAIGANARWGTLTVSAFADAAVVHNRTDPQPLPDRVASIGASAEWQPIPGIYGRFTFAQPLQYVQAPGDRNFQDRGFQFRVVVHPLQVFKAIEGE